LAVCAFAASGSPAGKSGPGVDGLGAAVVVVVLGVAEVVVVPAVVEVVGEAAPLLVHAPSALSARSAAAYEA
jgi:hypothetical protein